LDEKKTGVGASALFGSQHTYTLPTKESESEKRVAAAKSKAAGAVNVALNPEDLENLDAVTLKRKYQAQLEVCRPIFSSILFFFSSSSSLLLLLFFFSSSSFRSYFVFVTSSKFAPIVDIGSMSLWSFSSPLAFISFVWSCSLDDIADVDLHGFAGRECIEECQQGGCKRCYRGKSTQEEESGVEGQEEAEIQILISAMIRLSGHKAHNPRHVMLLLHQNSYFAGILVLFVCVHVLSLFNKLNVIMARCINDEALLFRHVVYV
jgi:hypothetical protein